MTTSKAFLKAYLDNIAPVGHEASGQAIWLRYLKPYIDTYRTDVYGTAVAIVNPDAPYKVVLEAHADEISWYINYINEQGYIYVIRNGGSDYQIAPSMQATVHAEDGKKHLAVFGWPAIHTRRAGPKHEIKPDIETIILDVGCNSKKEVLEKGINIGDVVTFNRKLATINDRYWVGRALDNRIGGYIIAEVVRRLHERGVKLTYGLYVVNAVQEEIGCRGAQMIAEGIKPDMALITDVCHCTHSPLYNKKREGLILSGKGPVLQIAPSIHPILRKMLQSCAIKHEIPYQLGACSTRTGTDTESFAYANAGTPSALLSTPLKYMHTTVEMVHMEDVEHLIQWFYHALCELKPHHDFKVPIL